MTPCESCREKDGWRCFHCGEVFREESEARYHFALDGIPPMCVDPLTKDEKARMTVVRKLESEILKLRKENEQLDQEAGCLHAMEKELSRYFGTCGGTPVKTASQAWLVHEAMVGRVEAAESQLAAQAEVIKAMRSEFETNRLCIQGAARLLCKALDGKKLSDVQIRTRLTLMDSAVEAIGRILEKVLPSKPSPEPEAARLKDAVVEAARGFRDHGSAKNGTHGEILFLAIAALDAAGGRL